MGRLAVPETVPRAGQGWWWRVAWSVVALATISSLVAWSETGRIRMVALLAQVIAATAIAALVVRPSLRRPTQRLHEYEIPDQRRVAITHIIITILYNVGLFVTLGAAAIRFGFLDFAYGRAIVHHFPLVTGLLLVLVALAAGWRIDEKGGVLQGRSTRAHAWIFFAWAGLVTAVAVVLSIQGELFRNGIPVLTEEDLLVLSLLTVMGASTQVFLAAGLPSTLDLAGAVVALVRRPAPGHAVGTPPVFYAVLIAVTGAAFVGFLLYRMDIMSRLGEFQNDRAALLLMLLPVALILFFTSSAVQVYRESRRGTYTRKMSSKQKHSLFVYGGSAILGGSFATMLVLHLTGRLPDYAWLPDHVTLSKDLIIATIVAGCGPIGLHVSRERRRVHNLESRLPDFLNDLAETRRAGLTLVAALRSSAMADYGSLTPEIRKMADQVSWGVPFTEAMRQFADRVPTDLVRSIVSLVIEASESGGSVTEILKAAARDSYEMKALEEDRRVTMTTYMVVIYVVFAVFIAVIGVLDAKFIPEVIAANEAVAASGGEPLGTAGIDRASIHFVYFTAAVVQAMGNGFVTGVLYDGRVVSGFRHVALMSILAWFVFRLLLGV